MTLREQLRKMVLDQGLYNRLDENSIDTMVDDILNETGEDPDMDVD